MVRYGAGPHDLEWENYDVENDFTASISLARWGWA